MNKGRENLSSGQQYRPILQSARSLIVVFSFFAALLLSATLVAAWTGPTLPPGCTSAGGSPPSCNTSAPLNVGTLSQVKNGVIGVNGLGVYGNSLLDWNANGGGTTTYLNFSNLATNPLTQSAGYGIEDNNGTLEFKNSGGSWQSLQAIVSGLATGGTITGVTAGTNMTGGGTSGNVTLSTSLTPTFNSVTANTGGIISETNSTNAFMGSSEGAGYWSGCFGSSCTGGTATQYGVYGNGSVYAGEFGGNVLITGTSQTNGAATFNSGPYTNDYFRVNGSGGIYWQNYGGGWYMSDSTWVRTYNNAGIWAGNGNIGTNGGLTVGYSGSGAPAGGAVFSGNVSIGTTNPVNLLTVNGNIADEGQANCSGSNALQTNSSGTLYCGSVSVSGGSLPYPVSSSQTWNWYGQSGQPSWLWGSNDGNNFYVWNPSNFSVSYANNAGNLGGVAASSYVTNGSSPTFGDAYVNSWYRVNSSGGIYWQAYGSGWFMEDSSWLRVYGSAAVYMADGFDTGTPAGIGCGGGLGAGYMLRVCGSEDVSSTVTASAFYYNSDERLKHNIATIATSTALTDVLALRPVTFNWNNVSLGTTTQIGFIAQEVQQVVPQIVQTNASTTMESVDYARVTPLLVGSVQALDQTIQDQQRQINSQQAEIAQLQSQVSSLLNK